MAIRNLTAANAIITLAIPSLYPVPQQLTKFAADRVYQGNPLQSAEVQMGVDGNLASGFVFTPFEWKVTLQANSESCDIFDNWWGASQVAQDVYTANVVVIMKSVGKKYTMTGGILTTFPVMPDAARILQPREFGITFERVSPQAG